MQASPPNSPPAPRRPVVSPRASSEAQLTQAHAVLSSAAYCRGLMSYAAFSPPTIWLSPLAHAISNAALLTGILGDGTWDFWPELCVVDFAPWDDLELPLCMRMKGHHSEYRMSPEE
jgi:hypothetical protein